MKLHKPLILAAILMVAAGNAVAATFVVPTDEELIAKSPAIVIGTVEGSYVQEAHGTMETTYEIRVERAVKGNVPARDELLRIVSLGGVIGDRGVLVPGEAHFEQGQRVLLFLSRDSRGRFRTTDFTLGRFAFRTSTRGEHLLVRSMEDVVGWDQSGRPHQEKVRREEGFLHFIEEQVHGRKAEKSYVVDASAVTLAPQEGTSSQIAANAAPFPAATYTDWVNNEPVRWPNMAAGVPVYKRSDQNIAGAADGGVSVIQNALAAWTNECGSVINYLYAGQVPVASTNHDGTNVVEFNDPQERISGAWGGSGTIGICFLSFAGEHTFDGQTWLNITDADVVFQNGYTASAPSFPTATTHELGHGLGWRHSNQDYATAGACNSATQECTSAAIMNSVVNASYGYTLQPWDVNAAQSVYPGGTCGGAACIPPVITSQPQSVVVPFGTTKPASVGATGTNLQYQWYVGRSGDTSSPIATGPTIQVGGPYSRLFWVRVFNECGSANSTTIAVSVIGSAAAGPNALRLRPVSPGWRMVGAADFTADGNEDILLQNTGSGQLVVWNTMRGGVISTDNFISPAPVSAAWRAIFVGDFNGDTRPDILLQNQTTNDIYVWTMNGLTATNTNNFVGRTATGWRVVAGGDLDRDGSIDLIVSNASSRQNAIWKLAGTGVVSTNTFLPNTAPGWEIQAVGDLSGDGWRDIIVRNMTSGENAAWTMNGFAVISTNNALAGVPNTAWRIISVGDFNGDGRVDLLWQSSNTDEAAVWIMNGFAVVSP
ncbi:MAG TPA: FG-GAP-like repeat-containing protein [Thermoanaerobaculia bacterium]|nr:FG-GAP-like repeat-containing protein [Thermoanaerobaculia bacterium]